MFSCLTVSFFTCSILSLELKHSDSVKHQSVCYLQSMYLFLDIMVGMGYSQEEIQESLSKMKYDEITATYLLLGRKSSEVSIALPNAKKQRNRCP